MVFSSNPLYDLDPPNWQYQQQQQQVSLYEGGNEIRDANSVQHQPLPQPPAATGGSRTIRPGSMTDRARMAKVPLPEMALKCPRCESTNTKFCYFNNYSLTQPRHFCKTCRRYWTRGGALRNVPVGGGCRRATKRSSKKRCKSDPAVSAGTATTTNSTDQTLGSCSADQNSVVGQFPFYPQASTNQMGHDQFCCDEYIGGGSYGRAPTDPHIARLLQAGVTNNSSTDQHWSRLLVETAAATSTMTQMHPPFPFTANMLQQQQQQHEHYYSSLPYGLLYQFDQRGGHLGLSESGLDSFRNSSTSNAMNKSMMDSTGTVVTQFSNVKMEDGNKGLTRLLGLQAQAAASNNNLNNVDNQLNLVGTGGGNAWADLFGYTSNASSAGP
ncbi:hypothetical protein QQ045_004456 [Rhodiola kirilowii]